MIFDYSHEACEWIDNKHQVVNKFASEHRLWYTLICTCDILCGGSVEANEVYMSNASEIRQYNKSMIEKMDKFSDICPYVLYSNDLGELGELGRSGMHFGGHIVSALEHIEQIKEERKNS